MTMSFLANLHLQCLPKSCSIQSSFFTIRSQNCAIFISTPLTTQISLFLCLLSHKLHRFRAGTFILQSSLKLPLLLQEVLINFPKKSRLTFPFIRPIQYLSFRFTNYRISSYKHITACYFSVTLTFSPIK